MLVGFTNGTPGGKIPEGMKNLATGGVGLVGWMFIIWLILSLLTWFILSRTSYGRKIYAIGNSTTCSLYSGINVKLVKMSAYMICGMMAALGGLLYSGRVTQLYLGMGSNYQMESFGTVDQSKNVLYGKTENGIRNSIKNDIKNAGKNGIKNSGKNEARNNVR